MLRASWLLFNSFDFWWLLEEHFFVGKRILKKLFTEFLDSLYSMREAMKKGTGDVAYQFVKWKLLSAFKCLQLTFIYL